MTAPEGFTPYRKQNQNGGGDKPPYLAIYTDGSGRFNAVAVKQWLADADRVQLYLDTDTNRLAVDPGAEGPDSYKLTEDGAGRYLELRGPLREFGIDHEEIEQSIPLSLERDAESGILIADLTRVFEAIEDSTPDSGAETESEAETESDSAPEPETEHEEIGPEATEEFWCDACGYGPDTARGVSVHHGVTHSGDTQLTNTPPADAGAEPDADSDAGGESESESESDPESEPEADPDTDPEAKDNSNATPDGGAVKAAAETQPSVVCEECGSVHKNEHGLSVHQATVHGEGDGSEAEEEEEEETLPEFHTIEIPDHITADAVHEAVSESRTLLDVADRLDWGESPLDARNKARTLLLRMNLYQELSKPEGGSAHSGISGMGVGRR